MGYETSFKLKEGVELDSQFKAYTKEPRKGEIKMFKNILSAICTNTVCENTSVDLMKAWKEISLNVRFYISTIEEDWKLNLKKQLDSEDGLILCGWGYARGRSYTNWDNIDEIIDVYTENLFSIAVINPECNPFDSESRNYSEKSERINSTIDEIEDTVWEAMNNMFVDRYRDSDDIVERGDDNNWGESDEEEDEDEEGDPLTNPDPIEDCVSESLKELKKCLKECKPKESDDDEDDDSNIE